MSLMQRTRLFNGPNWWSRYGEPVNAEALAQADNSPSDKGGFVQPPPMYGDGYVFAPGSCDCSPPCIWGLWTGYFQNPLRCNPGHLLHRHCGACGDGGACGNGCGLFGGHRSKGCNNCNTGCAAAVGCSTPMTCTTAAPDCGCKPVCCGKCRQCHRGGHWHGFMAHWNSGCNSCSSTLGCGCSTPVGCGCSTPLDAGLYSEKQASQGPPTPLPEDAAVYPLRRLK